MYNHYIPQSDGSYRRSSVPEHGKRQQMSRPIPSIPRSPAPVASAPPEPVPPPAAPSPAHTAPPAPAPEGGGIWSFLKGLLPRQIDTDDLLIILLIFLMNREEADSGGLSPMLTLALYFLL